MTPSRELAFVLGVGIFLAGLFCVPSAEAQDLRIDVGTGWAFPTNNVEQEAELTLESSDQDVVIPQVVDLKGSPHIYVGIGIVRSVGEKLSLGARLRAHRSNLSNTVECQVGTCTTPKGYYRAATVEGRVILTTPDWIHPYLLVGLGVVETSVDRVIASDIDDSELPSSLAYPEASVVDAGGDVGIGASVPLLRGLILDGEFRVTGALPGGKKNAVTMVPFSLGLSYAF